MKMEKSCKTCEFNFDGICAGDGDTYKYDDKIVDDTKCCDGWSAGLDYFTYATTNAPRFLREQLNDCRITYDEFSTALDNYIADHSVSINFFDAIKFIYGISMVDIAVLLDVTFGVVYRAKTKGIPQKRMVQFANALCVEQELLKSITTSDFEKLRVAREIFFNQPNIEKRMNAMPEWKKVLANTISSVYLHCPIHLAKEFARVDKMYWTTNMNLDDFTKSEVELIRYLSRVGKDGERCVALEYSLDLACEPHMRTILKTR